MGTCTQYHPSFRGPRPALGRDVERQERRGLPPVRSSLRGVPIQRLLLFQHRPPSPAKGGVLLPSVTSNSAAMYCTHQLIQSQCGLAINHRTSNIETSTMDCVPTTKGAKVRILSDGASRIATDGLLGEFPSAVLDQHSERIFSGYRHERADMYVFMYSTGPAAHPVRSTVR